MKKLISYCLIAILALVLVGCDTSTLSITGPENTATIKVGDNVTFTAASNLKDAQFAWSTSDDTIATIDSNGVVTAVAAGTVDIIVTVEKIGEKKITITIVDREITITGAENKDNLLVGDQFTLTATTDLTGAVYVWSSSDEAVATVSQQGLVTILAIGTVDITAKVVGVAEKKVTLTVNEYTLTLTGATQDNLYVNNTLALTATSTFPNAQFVWSSNNQAIATVDQNGLVTTLTAGTVIITVSVEGVDEKSVTLTVLDYTLTVTGAENNETFTVGDPITLTAITELVNAQYVWSSTNEEVATVNQQGEVNAIAAGTVDITVTVAGVGEVTITINVIDKEYTPAELKDLLQGVLAEYSASNNGYVKIGAVDGENTLSSELMFNYSAGTVESLMYRISGSSEGHLFVQDGFSYMFLEGNKSKSTLTVQEANLLMNSYGFSPFVSSVSAFYNENAFYTSLSLVSRVDNVLTYELDLSTYTGSVFATDGKDSIVIKVYLDDEQVVKVETLIEVDQQIKSTTLEFLGTSLQEIPYPADLDTY